MDLESMLSMPTTAGEDGQQVFGLDELVANLLGDGAHREGDCEESSRHTAADPFLQVASGRQSSVGSEEASMETHHGMCQTPTPPFPDLSSFRYSSRESVESDLSSVCQTSRGSVESVDLGELMSSACEASAESDATPDGDADSRWPCWGALLTGCSDKCTPGFVSGKAHFKSKFCSACLTCLEVPAARVRAVPAESPHMANSLRAGFWKACPSGTGSVRVINNTMTCDGPPLVVYKKGETPPEDAPWAPMPKGWAVDGVVRLAVAKGTLVPASSLRAHVQRIKPMTIHKRRRSFPSASLNLVIPSTRPSPLPSPASIYPSPLPSPASTEVFRLAPPTQPAREPTV